MSCPDALKRLKGANSHLLCPKVQVIFRGGEACPEYCTKATKPGVKIPAIPLEVQTYEQESFLNTLQY